MPWSQLTKLYLRGSDTYLYTSLLVLFECTNLVDCMLIIVAVGDIPHVPIIVLPRLRRLHLSFVEPGDSSPFFQYLHSKILTSKHSMAALGPTRPLRNSHYVHHWIWSAFDSATWKSTQMSCYCSLHICNHSSSSTSSTRNVLIIAYLVRYVIAKWTIIILFQGSRHCSFPMPRVITLMTSSSQA
jgi:hypothetical protein